ncbi:hypothetical protein A2995_01550 [Candidatus Nomurabacteria bacterium RIFCSPLOWO2_01_FULL_33_24]|uniref:OmpA-like domain-containing protein n=1 Tax=Candidatus Nomurabacteria bacterium RIFCSPLOWO2_01_FULL_33_24 TaxID=1801765 RepID=A0A1F6X062_9BACT|nr:MAG: hypothetical protein A2995_01550 [Candidatus Nomurabacteria bacterium RIFCSPLOWO2_01_FULL_33_24]
MKKIIFLFFLFLNIVFSQAQNNKSIPVEIKVLNEKNQPNNSFILIEEKGNNELIEGETDSLGVFRTTLKLGKEYKPTITPYNFPKNNDISFKSVEISSDTRIKSVKRILKIELDTFYKKKPTTDSIVYKRKYDLENVYFDFDRATLRPESNISLDKLVKEMELNPKMTIKLVGHTDSKGSDSYNMELSKKRALAVKKYIIDHGINSKRLSSFGSGETKPKTSNLTEEGRQKNRRTEVLVLTE